MGLEVSIVAGKDAASSSVKVTGSEQHVISDTEVVTFGVGDSALKNAVDKYFGKAPNDAFLHSPTPWNDLYKTYGWPQVQTVLDVQSATITGISVNPSVIASKTLTNDSKVPATFHADISQSVTNTATSSWSSTSTLSFSQSITYKVGLEGLGEVGGSTTFGFSQAFGQGGSNSQSTTVGSSTGVSVQLDPGQSVIADLTATKGTMNIRVVYNAHLTGDTAINYNPTYKGHHFWALGIGGVMSAGGIGNSHTITEDIEVGYYADSKVVLRDASSNQVIQELSLADKAA